MSDQCSCHIIYPCCYCENLTPCEVCDKIKQPSEVDDIDGQFVCKECQEKAKGDEHARD